MPERMTSEEELRAGLGEPDPDAVTCDGEIPAERLYVVVAPASDPDPVVLGSAGGGHRLVDRMLLPLDSGYVTYRGEGPLPCPFVGSVVRDDRGGWSCPVCGRENPA